MNTVLYNFSRTQSLLDDINNKSLKKSVEEFLNVLTEELKRSKISASMLPEIRLTVEDDNVFLEWIFNRDFRIGFTIVTDKKDSSWFVFLNNEYITKSVSGSFETGYQHILRKLMMNIRDNV